MKQVQRQQTSRRPPPTLELVATACLLLAVPARADTPESQASPHGSVRCEDAINEARALSADPNFVSDDDRAFAFMCASDAYMKRKLYMEAEEALLRCREISAREGKARIERDCLSRLGVLYGEQGRIDDLVSAWDDYISLNAAPIFLTDPMLDLAEKAFAAGDYERAHALVSRVERHHAGRGYGRLSLDRSWIPDLYVKLGQPAHAEQIFVARLATLHASWELADELEHYAAFLSSQGRLDEAKRMRERAAALRDGNSSD